MAYTYDKGEYAGVLIDIASAGVGVGAGIGIGAAATAIGAAAPALVVGGIAFGATVGAGILIDWGANQFKDYIYKR
ncbi:hypothetical protein [Clostridium sp.]|uniref:hypothetical protein n=1 Tax=Clostridium sp. TaxID=1506 RepID=UPI00321659EE